MPRKQLLLLAGGLLLFAAAFGAGAYVNTRGFSFLTPTPTPRPTTPLSSRKELKQYPSYDAYMKETIGKTIKAYTVAGFNFAIIDKPLAQKMATSSSDVVTYKDDKGSISVLYAFIKAVNKENITVAQGNKEYSVSIARPFAVYTHNEGKFVLFSYGDEDLTQTMKRCGCAAEGAPTVLLGVTKQFDNWKAAGTIVYR